MTKTAALSIAAICSALTIIDGKPVSRVQLLPMGESDTRNGKPPKVIVSDRAHADAIVASTLAHWKGTDMMIDYDHQSVSAFRTGGRAPAAGWVKGLSAADDGVWAEVEWNAAAASAIEAGEYRYISPFFFHRPDGRVTKIVNAGLTNTPNLELAAVASALADQASTEEDEDNMTFKAIASALGLAEDADEATIIAAIAAKKAEGEAFAATASALGVTLGEGVELSAVATAAADAIKGKVDMTKFVPVTAVQELQASIATMQSTLDSQADQRRKDMIADATKDGRLPPALKAHAEGLDEVALASFLGSLVPGSLSKPVLPGAKPGDANGELTQDEASVASMLGIKPDDFLKTRKEMHS